MSEDLQLSKDEADLALLIKARADAEAGKVPDPELAEAEAILEDKDASAEDKNWAKRYSDTKSAWYKERNTKDQAIANLQEKLKAAESASPEAIPTNVEDLKEWQKKHPAVASAVRAIATEIAKEMTGDLDKKVTDLTVKDNNSTAALTKATVVKAHPDFDKVNENKAFHDWVKDQDSWVDAAVYKGQDAKSIIQAISLFKMENNLLGSQSEAPSGNTDRDDDAAAASLVAKGKVETPPTPKGKLLESVVLTWTDEDWAKNKPLYDKARREGTLVLDVTNAA